MAVITINGQIGCGALEIGEEVARALGWDYVDRRVLAEAGKRVRATVTALEEKEARIGSLRDRLARLLQRALERSAVGSGGDLFFGPGIEALLSQPYPEGSHEPLTRAQEVDDLHFVQAVGQAIRDLAEGGNLVIIGRASNMVLQDRPDALHIGLVAPLERRVAVVMHRQGVDRARAERFVAEQERARLAYFRRFYKVHPDDPSLYHLVLNTGQVDFPSASRLVLQAASAVLGVAP